MVPVIKGNTRCVSSPSCHHCCVLSSLLLTDLFFTSFSYHPLTYFPKVQPDPLGSALENSFVCMFDYQPSSDDLLLSISGPATSVELQIDHVNSRNSQRCPRFFFIQDNSMHSPWSQSYYFTVELFGLDDLRSNKDKYYLT